MVQTACCRVTYGLVGHAGLEFLGLVNHLLDFGLGGHTATQVFLLIDLSHLGGEIGGNAMTQFLHGVNTGGLQQLSELRADAIDTEQVGMVGPLENQFLADAGFFGYDFASRGSFTCIE